MNGAVVAMAAQGIISRKEVLRVLDAVEAHPCRECGRRKKNSGDCGRDWNNWIKDCWVPEGTLGIEEERSEVC